MKILYLVPGPMSKGPMGSSELDRRKGILQGIAFEGTQVEIQDVPDGPASIESAYDELMAVPATLRGIVEAERDGFDAVIIGCFGDPGLEAARELVDIPVIGPGEASLLAAAGLGHRFSVVTILDNVVASQEHQAHRAGVLGKLASVEAIGIPVLELMGDREATIAGVVAAGQRAIDRHRADTLMLGCMTLSFMGIGELVSAELGVPVLEANRVALKSAESLVSLGLSHSSRAYPRPPKLPAISSPEVPV